MLSLVGVQIASASTDPDVEQSPALFDHYLVAADSNDAELVHAFHRAGVPVELASAMTFRRTGDADQSGNTSRPGIALASVIAPGGSFSVAFHATQAGDLEQRHEHADSFWYMHSGHSVRLELMLHHARDRACAGEYSNGCHADVTTNPRSTIALLLGATSVSHDLVAIDHEKIPVGTAIVKTQTLTNGRARYAGPPQRPNAAPNDQSPFDPYLNPKAPLSHPPSN